MRYSYRDEHIVGRKTDIVGGPPAVLIFSWCSVTPQQRSTVSHGSVRIRLSKRFHRFRS
jgi:hypothetical protein